MLRQSARLRSSAVIIVTLCLAMLCGADGPAPEYKVKAAFLYNFARFVEWPPEAFSNAGAPFVIAVVGTDPFGGALEEAVTGKKVGTRRVEIQHFESVDKIGSCQILFMPTVDDDMEARIMTKVRNGSVLTVGESDNFDAIGGCIRFFMEDGKIRFEVNTDATSYARLRISSKLLKLARIFKK